MQKSSEKFKFKLLKIGVAALILAIPLYPKFPFLSVPGTYVSIRLEDFLLGIVGIIWLWNAYPDILRMLKNRTVQAILLFLGIGLLSVISASFLTQTAPTTLGILHWLRRVEYFLCFFIGITAVKSKEDLLFYVKCLLIVIFYAFVYGVGQKYFHWPIITTQNFEYSKGIALFFMEGGHLVSTFAGHYDMATVLLLFLPILLALLFVKIGRFEEFANKNKQLLFRVIIGIVFLCGFWLLVNTASRISIASYFISTLSLLIIIRKFKFIPILLIISIIFISFSTNLLARYTQIFEVYIKRMVTVPYAYAQDETLSVEHRATPAPVVQPVVEDRSTSIRLNVEWPRAIRAFTKNPFLGTGFSSITLATDNDYLRLLGEVGILGFLSFMLIIARMVLFYLKKIMSLKTLTLRKAFMLGVAASIPGVMLNAVFIDVFEASKFAILFWLLVGFSYSKLFSNTNE